MYVYYYLAKAEPKGNIGDEAESRKYHSSEKGGKTEGHVVTKDLSS